MYLSYIGSYLYYLINFYYLLLYHYGQITRRWQFVSNKYCFLRGLFIKRTEMLSDNSDMLIHFYYETK